jgi:predicted ATPase/anti-anti-sigma regulatory factor/tRNA A-37 threonylcarbamoyl transferase component Bud32
MQEARYTILEKIHEGSNTIIHRGKRDLDGLPVILKTPKANNPSKRDVARIVHQYELMKDLNLPGITNVYDVEKIGNSAQLILEHFDGEGLQQSSLKQRLNLREILQLGVALANALADLHSAGIIHKDIKPHNILINRANGSVKLTDFGIASKVQYDSHLQVAHNRLEGTLSYIAPEQTGRMNRAVDHRSDLYSFGVTLYQMLTNSLPFQSLEPLEVIHSHIARMPVAPIEIDPSIPSVVSDIVMKLLAKNPEDRYQSASSLKADLQLCLDRLQQQGKIIPFPLDKHALAESFRIPQKLYGREKELAILLSAFERINDQKTELVLVAGYSGVGKSALVRELQRHIAQKRGYFLSGKFDQYKRDIPYASLLQALQEIVGQVRQESESYKAELQTRLSQSLGDEAGYLLEVLPSFAALLPEAPEPSANKPALADVLEKCLHVVAQSDHPLVLFLDDLQWADLASLQFIQQVLEHNVPNVLLLGAYRDNEVSSTHPLMLAIEGMREQGCAVEILELQPLLPVHVLHLIADACASSENYVQPLVDVVYNKTLGNPFYLNQFLKTLHEERLLYFDQTSQQWQWNMATIEQSFATANVVEFMTSKLQRLPTATQEILMYAACIGSRFDARTLASVREQPLLSVLRDISPAVDEGLIVPLNTDFALLISYHQRMESSDIDEDDEDIFNAQCRFLHDRVQQAAYQLLDENQKAKTHLAIGSQMLRQLDSAEIEESIFDIVNQINLGAKIVPSMEQRLLFAELNLKAAKRAHAASAYGSAISYLSQGIAFLPEDSWEHAFGFTKELYELKSICLIMQQELEESSNYFNTLIEHVDNDIDKVDLFIRHLDTYYLVHRNNEVVALGLSALRMFGINFPSDPAEQEAAFQQSLQRLETALAGRSVADLKDLPKATDQTQIAVMRLLLSYGPVCYAVAPYIFALCQVEAVIINIQYGHSIYSPYSFSCFGIMNIGMFNDRVRANEYSNLALELDKIYPNPEFSARVITCAYGMMGHWFMPLSEASDRLVDCVKHAQEVNDPLYVIFAIWYKHLMHYIMGDTINNSLSMIYQYFDTVYHLQNSPTIDSMLMQRHMLFALQGKTKETQHFINDQFNEANFLTQEHAPHANYIYNFYKMLLAYWFDDYEKAIHYANQADIYVMSMVGQVAVVEVLFMRGLACCQLYADASEEQKAEYLTIVERDLQELQTLTAYYPANHRAKERLLAAEYYRITQRPEEASDAYVEAMEEAQTNKIYHVEALSYELTAKYYLSRKHKRVASQFLTDAYLTYMDWGASAKAQRLLKQYPEMILLRSDNTSTHIHGAARGLTTSTSVDQEQSELLDMTTVLKASQAISGEMELDQLLKKLMQIMLESAGAQRGVLLLSEDNQFNIAAIYQIEPEEIKLQLGDLSDNLDQAPLSIIEQVQKQNVSVVLHNASNDGSFQNDPYVLRNKCKSVLCVPLLHQQRLTGILYLENNLASHVFTSERLELLRLLSVQAVIALENALLYNKAQRVTEELRIANEQLQLELLERQRAQEIQGALQEEIIHAQKTALAELSTPLIPITDHIMVMPLIGTIDSQRAEQIISTLLDGTQVHHAQVVIIDITGVPVVDTGVASSLIQAAQAIRLLGAQTYISGIRPEVAQTLVGLGVELSGIMTQGSLQNSIAYALDFVNNSNSRNKGWRMRGSQNGHRPVNNSYPAEQRGYSNGNSFNNGYSNGNGGGTSNGNGSAYGYGNANGSGYSNGNGGGHNSNYDSHSNYSQEFGGSPMIIPNDKRN